MFEVPAVEWYDCVTFIISPTAYPSSAVLHITYKSIWNSIEPNEWDSTETECISTETTTTTVDNGDGTSTITTVTITTNSCDGTTETTSTTTTVDGITNSETISITPEDDNSENWDSEVTWDDED